jgi:hypothetical protein
MDRFVSRRNPAGPNPRNDPDCNHDTRFKPESSVLVAGMTKRWGAYRLPHAARAAPPPTAYRIFFPFNSTESSGSSVAASVAWR